jgi:hypothetical protein
MNRNKKRTVSFSKLGLFKRGFPFGTLVVVMSLLTSCDKVAGLVAPSPGDFLQAWRGALRDAQNNSWKPIRGATTLGKNPRAGFARCIGREDGDLQRCLAIFSRVDAVSLPLFEACVESPAGDSGPYACAEFAAALSPLPGSLEGCRGALGARWPSCVLARATRRDDVPPHGLLLHDLEAWSRLESARENPRPLAAVLPGANPTSNITGGTRRSTSGEAAIGAAGSEAAVAAVVRGAPTAPTPAPFISVSRDENRADLSAQKSTDDALAPIDESTFRARCADAMGSARSACDTFAVDARRGAFSSEAVRLCLLLKGEPKDPRHSLDCLLRARDRVQSASGLRACEQAFDETHPGHLFFVKGCVARSGFRSFSDTEREAIERTLEHAASNARLSRFSVLEKYAELARKVREESQLIVDAF